MGKRQSKKQKDNPLLETERLLNNIFAGLPDGISILDNDMNIIRVNQVMEHWFSYAIPLIGKKCYEVFHRRTEPCEVCLPYQTTKTGKSANEVVTKVGANGEIVGWFNLHNFPIIDMETGQNKGLIEYVRDITQYKMAEKALIESRETLATVLDGIDADVYIADMDNHQILFMNKHMKKSFGEHLIGEKCWKVFRGETGPCAHCNNKKLVDPDGNATGVLVWENKNPITNRYYLNYDRAIQWVDGHLVRLQVATDITERMQAEEKLRSSEEKYRTILEEIEEGYYEVDLAGNITFCNDSFNRIWGYSKEELIGTNYKQGSDPENAKKLFQAFNQVYRTGIPTRGFDWQVIRKDGTKRYFEVSISLQKDGRGNLSGFRGMIHDITERKQAEVARLKSEAASKKLAEENAVMAEIGRIIGSTLNINEVYERFSEEAKKIIPFDRITINLINDKDQTFTFAYLSGTPISTARQGDVAPLAGGITEMTARTQTGLIIDLKDGDEIATRHPRLLDNYRGGIRSSMTAPLFSKNQMIGILHFQSFKPNAYTEYELRLAERVANQIAGAIANAQIFIEQKRTEKALQESEKNFKDLFDNAPLGYHEYDSEGRITQVNQTDLAMLGYTAEEMIGKPIWWLNVNEEVVREQVMAKLAGSLPPGKGVERIYWKKDGSTLPVLTEDKLIFDERGRIKGIRSTIQDITVIKETEEALRKSEEESRNLANENAIMAEIGQTISSTLNIDEVYNRFAEKVQHLIPFDRIAINLGNLEENSMTVAYSAGIFVPERNAGTTFALTGTFTEEILRTRKAMFLQGNQMEIIARFPGLRFSFDQGLQSMLAVPMLSKDEVIGVLNLRSTQASAYTENHVQLGERVANQIAGAIANAQLFSERQRAEQEKALIEGQLRQSQKMEAVGLLAGGIAHDFNNLLTVIKGYAQLSLLDLKENNVLKENIEEIQKASERAADLTRQLLAFGRRQILELKVISLNTIIQDLDKMLRRILGEDIQLVYVLDENIGKVKTDPGQIEQVIMNLAVNARDAMPLGGKLLIETSDVELDEAYCHTHTGVTPGHYVRLTVSDTGCGMSPEIRDRVFDPFFSTKEKGKGTGLGLSTVYGIVKQSNGNILVYSEPEKGTSFKIYLPRIDGSLEEYRSKEDGQEIPLGNETILVVEDEDRVRNMTCMILKKQGYTVLEANNGNEALSLFRERNEPIDLVLTDVVMPGMSGRQLAESLKEAYQEVKVLYMSGYTENAIAHHGILEEGIQYIQKPFTLEKLARKVRQALAN